MEIIFSLHISVRPDFHVLQTKIMYDSSLDTETYEKQNKQKMCLLLSSH